MSRRGARRLVDFALPTGCVACRAWIPTPAGETPLPPIVCDRCRTRLARASWPRCPRCHAPRGTGRTASPDCLECREWSPSLTRARYAHLLVPPATDLVHALKYEGWRELAATMGGAMANAAAAHVEGLRHRSMSDSGDPRTRDGEDGWIVVAVPTTARRLTARGYNQARLLAQVVARRLALPLVSALERPSAPASQTTLSPAARRENVRDAFAVRRPTDRRLNGADILLVDDVLTTGATGDEAARSLATAGARTVSLITFARALPGFAVDRRGGTGA